MKNNESEQLETLRINKIKEREKEMQPFYDEVKKNGIDTDYYVGIKESHLNPKIVEILLKHLTYEYTEPVKNIIIHALDSTKAKGYAGKALVELYKVSDNKFRYEIGHTLTTVATKNELDNILDILNDKSIDDEGKVNLPATVTKLMGKQAVPILVDIIKNKKSLNENNLFVFNSLSSLGKLKAIEGKEFAEYYTKHKDSWYRSQAKKILKKINSIKQIVPKLPKGIKFIKDNKFAWKYEASTDFDLEKIPDFLQTLANKIDINPKELEKLILDTEVEQTKTYELEIKQMFRTSKLYFQIFMGDIDTPALYFYSNSKSLIKIISKVIDQFMENYDQ